MGEKEKHDEVAKREPTMAERFTGAVIREFGAIMPNIQLTPFQKRLAQHLFLKIDVTLGDLEKKRLASGREGLPIAWGNINMTKLATDAMHRIDLGLDALIANHISPIPYFNARTRKYDLDLRIGYTGKDYYRRKMALEPPVDIIYELVYENDKFVPIKATPRTPVESYEFDIPKPFDRGEVIGGFAYIKYEDERKNKLIIVSEKDFQKSQALARSDEFWSKWPVEMRYKTLVHRATDKLIIDPAKVSASFFAVERDDDVYDAVVVKADITEHANAGEPLAIEHIGGPEETPPTEQTEQQAEGEPVLPGLPPEEQKAPQEKPAPEKKQKKGRGPGF